MINIVAPITTQTSYGLVSLNLIKEMSKLTEIAVFPITNLPIGQVERHPYFPIDRELSNGQFFNRDAPCLRIFHQFSMDLMCGSRYYGMPIFELDTFSNVELHHLQNVDVIVNSKWAKGVCESHNIASEVVPLGVDTKIFYPRKKPKDFTVVHIGKAEVRKNSKLIVDACAEAFKHIDARLILAWQNPFTDMNSWNNYAVHMLGDKVSLIPRLADFRQSADILNAGHLFVSLSSAEGWNMPLLEAMACGLDVISSNNTGQTEFAQGRKIEPGPLVDAYDGIFFHGQGRWHDMSCKFDELVSNIIDSYNKWKQNEHRFEYELPKWSVAAERLVTIIGE